MKCNNCGGHYKMKDLQCPYCGKTNLIGRAWMVDKSEAEREYEATRKETMRIISPFVLNRVLNRILFVALILGVVTIVGVFIAFFFEEQYIKVYQHNNKGKIEETLKTYYENGEFAQLYDYLDKYDLSGDAYYGYMQAALLTKDYEDYRTEKMCFLEMSDEEKEKDDYHLNRAFNKSAQVYTLDLSLYKTPDPMNEALIEKYRTEIMSFWIGTMGISRKDIDTILTADYIYSADRARIIKEAKSKELWKIQN